MTKENFNLCYIKYNKLNTMIDRLNFCMEVLKPTTCNKLGTFLDIPVPTISRIKNGETKNTNEGYLRAIAGYFDVTYEWLVISKYYPIFEQQLNTECINNLDIKTEIRKVLVSDENKISSKIENELDYQQICNSLPFYKDLFNKFVLFLNESNYLEKIEEQNIEKMISCMNDLEQEKNYLTLKQENLRKIIGNNKYIPHSHGKFKK